MKSWRYLIFVLIFGTLGFTGWACSNQKTEIHSDSNANQNPAAVVILFTEKLNLVDQKYDSQLIKHTLDGQNTYWQLVKTNGVSAGTIVYSVPEKGIDWSSEDLDQRWVSADKNFTGTNISDVDGPLYDPATSKNIFYQRIKKEAVPELGLGLTKNGYDVLYVFHRFYAGRYADDYVSDISHAVTWLKGKAPHVQIGLFGTSLGGFISAQATQEIAPPDLKATVLVSPLLSWPQQSRYIASLATLISDQTKQDEYVDFFEPYARRFSNIDSSQMDTPSYSIPTLLIHDEWDTIVPIEQANTFKQLNGASVTFLKFSHPTPVDFVMMSKEHFQTGSGLSPENIAAFYLAFLFNHVGVDQRPKSIAYSQPAMDLLFNEMYSNHATGKDITGFQQALKEICKPNFSMDEAHQAAPSENGPQYLTRKLNSVWGLRLIEADVCTYLDTGAL